MPGTLDLLLRLAVSMAVVMGVMGLAARFLRHRANAGGSSLFSTRSPGVTRGRARARTKKVPGPELEITCRRALSKGASVALVQALGKRYLVGVTDHAVSILASLPDSAIAEMADEYPIVLPEDSRMLPSPEGLSPATQGNVPPTNAWKLAIDSLRERTVRR
jgi:hypothetical protein